MDIKQIMTTVERQRKLTKTHKNTLCSAMGISQTYYNKLLLEGGNPSFNLVNALLKHFGMHLGLIVTL